MNNEQYTAAEFIRGVTWTIDMDGAVTYLLGRGGGVWGHDALPALDALIAKKMAEFERLKS